MPNEFPRMDKKTFVGPLIEFRGLPNGDNKEQEGFFTNSGIQVSHYRKDFQLRLSGLIGTGSDFAFVGTGEFKDNYVKGEYTGTSEVTIPTRWGRTFYGLGAQVGLNYFANRDILCALGIGGDLLSHVGNDTVSDGSSRSMYGFTNLTFAMGEDATGAFQLSVGNMSEDRKDGKEFSNLFFGMSFYAGF